MSDEENPLTPAEAVTAWVEENWEDEHERPRGILTDTDRQFLWGVKEYDSKVTTSERRRAIRERVEHSLRDLSYLMKLEEFQREKVFDSLEGDTRTGELRSAVATLIQFLYHGLDGDIEWFEETIAHGISNAENDLRDDDTTYYAGGEADAGVDVDINVRRGFNVDRIERQLRSGEGHTLTPTEIGVLAREGRLGEGDVHTLDSTTANRIVDPNTGEIVQVGLGIGDESDRPVVNTETGKIVEESDEDGEEEP